MSNIIFNLNNTAQLGIMVPPVLPAGGFGMAALPPGMAGMGGIYIIANLMAAIANGNNPNLINRYIGTSANLAHRFSARMGAVTELGIPAAEMNQVVVWWGTITIQNTPALHAPPPAPVNIVHYAPPLWGAVDGVPVNLEKLLIRFVLTQLGAGGTVSNNLLAFVPYTNPTPNPVTVDLAWAANAFFQASQQQSTWQVGAQW